MASWGMYCPSGLFAPKPVTQVPPSLSMDEKDITDDLLKEYLIDIPVEELNHLMLHENTNQMENSDLLNRNTSQTENSAKLPEVEHTYEEDIPAIPDKVDGKHIDHDTDQAKNSFTIPEQEKNNAEDVATDHVSPKQQINLDTKDPTILPEVERNYKEDVAILSLKIKDYIKAAKKAFQRESQKKNIGVAIEAEPIAFRSPEGSSNDDKAYPLEKKKKKQPAISCGKKPVPISSDIPADIMANLHGLEKWMMNREEMRVMMEHKHPVQLSMARRLQGWTMELKQRASNLNTFDAYYSHQDFNVTFRSVTEVITFVLYNFVRKQVKDEPPSKRKALVNSAAEPSRKKRKITRAEEIEVQKF
ncbi:unnamed protein product [Linum trigynum]|uniref:Uncharacterized protein n=1 Tax=Linum trigynum TaxID=586398 RepID=A0AAV2FQ89_9ROSI